MEHSDRVVAKLVDAISILIGDRVLCIVAQEDDGNCYTVCPFSDRLRVLGVMARIDWNEVRARVVLEAEFDQ